MHSDRHTWVTHRERFDQMLAPYDAPLLDAAAPKAGETVIDVGCERARRPCRWPIGSGSPGTSSVSIPREKLRRCPAASRRRRRGERDVVTGDAATYPTARGSDLIISRFATMLFPSAVPAHRHLFSGLRPGGRLATVVWQSLERNLWHALPLRAVLAHLDLGPPDRPHLRVRSLWRTPTSSTPRSSPPASSTSVSNPSRNPSGLDRTRRTPSRSSTMTREAIFARSRPQTTSKGSMTRWLGC